MAHPSKQLVICLDNSGYEASLEMLKVYVALFDPVAAKRGQWRIIDESGEDYLYSKKRFIAVALPQAVKRAALQAAA